MLTAIILLIILVITALAPLLIKKVEENLEPFLLVMGLIASLAAGALTADNVIEIFGNKLLYIITAAVFVVSFLFRFFEDKIGTFNSFMLKHLPLKLIVFLLVVCLGFISSVITAIVASLLLTEFMTLLPIDRKAKVRVSIIGCFSIGLGAALTPVGEPLPTIVISKLDERFTYLITLIGAYVFVGILLLGVLSTFFVSNSFRENFEENGDVIFIPERETTSKIVIRSVKIFVFVVGLDLLGNGFKPLIDAYVIHWDNSLLYFANMLSAILDNATLAAAEVSPAMTVLQIKSIMMSLLVSGGMLITGNIPNIITAGRLKISVKEWAKFAVPLGIFMLMGFYIALFAF